MTHTERAYEPSAGALYGAIGVFLIVLGTFGLANANEAGVFGLVGVGLIATGSYLTIAGAVARGTQLARSQSQVERRPARTQREQSQ